MGFTKRIEEDEEEEESPAPAKRARARAPAHDHHDDHGHGHDHDDEDEDDVDTDDPTWWAPHAVLTVLVLIGVIELSILVVLPIALPGLARRAAGVIPGSRACPNR